MFYNIKHNCTWKLKLFRAEFAAGSSLRLTGYLKFPMGVNVSVNECDRVVTCPGCTPLLT